MNRQEAEDALTEASMAISFAVEVLRPHAELFRQFAEEKQHMDSIGHIIDPTLFNSSERRAAEAIVAPLFKSALALVDVHAKQIKDALEALAKVQE